MRFLIILLTVCSTAVARDIPVESSEQLLAKPKSADTAEPLRLKVSQEAAERCKVGPPEITNESGRMKIRFTIENTSGEDLELGAATAFIKTDGTVYTTRRRGVVDGVVRATVGVISLGLSEVGADERLRNPTLRTTHKLGLASHVMVEHVMPFASEHVVGSYTYVSWVDPNPPELTGIHGALHTENARYEKEEAKIRAEQEKHEFGSEEWKKWNDKFWEAHRAHFKRREEIWKKQSEKRKEK